MKNAYEIQLTEKIRNKTAKVGVIGLGYVGLPLAVEKAKAGFDVIGFDIQEKKVSLVNAGINYIGDIVNADLELIVKEGKLTATNDFSFVKDVDTVAICVPTPLDLYKQPDLSYVINSAESIAKHMRKGVLIVLESTTYPGTTEEVLKPIFEKDGSVCGEDFFLAFSPERIDPGNKDYNTKNTPKVVGGCTESCTELAALLYEVVLEGDVYKVSSPAAAEMEKILENIFRNINIALVNEMALLCNRMKIDIWEVIDAAKTKPYGYMAFYPGPGLGGHCIPLDPAYLAWKAREYNFHTKLIETSAEINDYMPEFAAESIMKILNQHKKATNGAKVLFLGMAYKKDIADYRESPTFKIIEHLEKYGAEIIVSDPFIPSAKVNGKEFISIDWDKVIDDSDITIITTAHSCYPYDEIIERSKLVYDTRNATQKAGTEKSHVYKL